MLAGSPEDGWPRVTPTVIARQGSCTLVLPYL